MDVKICLLSSCYALDEKDRHASFLVESNRYLRQRGHHISVFAPSYLGRRSHVVDGIEVHRFRYFFKRWEKLTHMEGAPTRVRNPIYLLIAASYIVLGLVQAVFYCWRRKFDIIHVHWPFPHAIWGYAASRLTGSRMVLTFHGAEVLLCRKFFFVKYFLRHALRHSDAVICNSSFTAQKVRALGVDVPIQVIPFGTTVNVRPATKVVDKPIKDVLFAGRLIERKGVEYLLRAIPIVRQTCPVHLHIVGVGDIRSRLEQIASDLWIAENVTFHGFVANDELERLYRDADVFVLPAIVDDRGDTEGLGVVLIEAISHCTPVVASRVGGIADVVKHEETGLLVDERCPGQLADAIVRLLTNDELRSRVVARGLAHAQSYLDWQNITDQLTEIYDRVAGAKASSGLLKVGKAPHSIDRGRDSSQPDAPSDLEPSPDSFDDARTTGAPAQRVWSKLLFRALFSLAILAALFTQISINDVVNNLRRVSPAFILFAWCYYAFCQLISAYRWQLLLRAKQVHVGLGQLFSFYMIGMFVNNFMPGSIGGDVVKSYHLFRQTRELEIAAVSVFLERFTGLIGLTLISIIALAIGYRELNSVLVWGAVMSAILVLICIMLVLWQLPNILRRLPLISRLFPQPITKFATGLYAALASYRHHAPTLLIATIISAFLQFLFAVYYACAAAAMGFHIELMYFVLFLPAVTLISLIPLSIGGLGLRDAAMVVLFGAVGISQADILSVSLTVHIINTILSFWGGVLLIKNRVPPSRSAEPA